MLVGYRSREHSLSRIYEQCPEVGKIIVVPGNDLIFYQRTKEIIKVPDADICNPNTILEIAQKYQPDLIEVQQAESLISGVVNRLKSHKFRVFGPSKEAAQIETNKHWSRDFMRRWDIPTPQYHMFKRDDKSAIAYANTLLEDVSTVFFKISKLHNNIGVFPASTKQDVLDAFKEVSVLDSPEDVFLVEEGLVGEEFSYYVIANGDKYVTLGSAQDNKRLFDGDRGPNTSGMGAHSPISIVNGKEKMIEDVLIAPVLKGLNADGCPYTGILYLGGIYCTNGNIYPIEYNARWGDPETQTILPSIKNNYFNLVNTCFDTSFETTKIIRDKKCRVSSMVVIKGYPHDDYSHAIGKEIKGLKDLLEDQRCTIDGANVIVKDNILSMGSARLFTITTEGDTVLEAQRLGQTCLQTLDVQELIHYRTDIGRRDL